MKTPFLVLVTSFACLITQELQSQILAGPITNTANGHWYYLLEGTYWTNAEAQAVSLGGHLVTINDAAENAWVLNTFGNIGGVPRQLHIGLTDEGHEGNWVWISGEPAAYRNWAPGEPNNGNGYFPYENYSMMHAPGSGWPEGSWNDLMGSLAVQQYWGVVEVGPTLAIRVSEVELCWPTMDNVVYQLQYRSSVTANNWTNLGSQVTGTGSRMCFKDPVPAGQGQRFYRVITVP